MPPYRIPIPEKPLVSLLWDDDSVTSIATQVNPRGSVGSRATAKLSGHHVPSGAIEFDLMYPMPLDNDAWMHCSETKAWRRIMTCEFARGLGFSGGAVVG